MQGERKVAREREEKRREEKRERERFVFVKNLPCTNSCTLDWRLAAPFTLHVYSLESSKVTDLGRRKRKRKKS